MRQCSLLFAGLAPTCALVVGRLIYASGRPLSVFVLRS
jgi:hypothetical protein